MINVAGSRATTLFGDDEGFCRASLIRCDVLGKVFRFNHKIIINV
jgi:hypothetical protein